MLPYHLPNLSLNPLVPHVLHFQVVERDHGFIDVEKGHIGEWVALNSVNEILRLFEAILLLDLAVDNQRPGLFFVERRREERSDVNYI